MADANREVAGRYLIESTLGSGGAAAVFRAKDRVTGDSVALKRLSLANERHRDRFLALFEREYHTLAELAHPAVIRVFDYGVDETGPYYTMELLEGQDLRKLAPVPYRDACAFGYDVASALSLLHSRRLVHRDVTSRNVIVSGGRAKLIDFGALLPMGTSQEIVGTPLYMAPEVVLTQALDGRTDLYSLGVVLFHTLTGQFPFRAQTTQDLRSAWRKAPALPSQLTDGFPPELDRLVLSLLALDRSARPRDASEVMERLAAIAGLERTEKGAEARAYLVAPTLVGRERESKRAHDVLIRAFQGEGGGLLIRGPSGVGRSRMLDACVLDAKVLGAAVVRAGAATAQAGPFGAAQALLEQLDHAIPGALDAVADEPQCDLLFSGEPPAERRLADLGRIEGRRQDVLAALRRLFLKAGGKRLIVIAVDDLFRLDEPSVTLLATLQTEAPFHRILIVGTAPSDVAPPDGASFRSLIERLEKMQLDPLDSSTMRTLFRSIFDAVPNVEVVSDRIFALSGGSPRDAITLAEFLVDRGVIQYHSGAWALPGDVERGLLPDGIAGALRERIAALTPLARKFACAHALSARDSLRLADFVLLGRDVEARAVHHALDELVAADVFLTDGNGYALRHDGWRAVLTKDLDDAERRLCHAELARVLELGRVEPLEIAYHLLLANDEGRALDVLEAFIQTFDGQIVELFDGSELGEVAMGEMFEHAIDACVRLRRSRRLYRKLRAFKMGMGVFVDATWFLNQVPEVVAHLKKESGYLIWESLDPSMDPMARILTAMGRAQADYDAAPEEERVFPPGEAIRNLVQYVIGCVSVGARTFDKALHRSMPDLLVPFAPLSPVVAAILENTRAIVDVSYGRNEESRPRYLAVIEQLSSVGAASLPHAEEIRDALIYGLGVSEMRLGLTSASAMMDRIIANPRHRSTALTVKSIIALQQGDWESARDLKRQAELFDMESDSKQLFSHTNVKNELDVFALGDDLGAVKRIAEILDGFASKYPGWLPSAHTARAEYARLRGDLDAALSGFEQCIALSEPASFDECPDMAWYPAASGKMETLISMGRATEAKEWGERALRFSGGRPSGTRYQGIKRALALAEAKLGDFEAARARLDSLIEERRSLGTTGVFLGVLYESAAQVGLWAGDRDAYQRFVELAAGEFLKFPSSGFKRRYEALLEAGRPAESDDSTLAAPSAVLDVVTRREATTLVAQAMQSAGKARDRAQRGLALLCERGNAAGGYLYLLSGTELVHAASEAEANPPEPGLTSMLAAWFADAMGDESETRVGDTDSTSVGGSEPVWNSADGKVYHPVAIRASLGGMSSPVGVAALRYETSSVAVAALAEVAFALGDYFLQTGAITVRTRVAAS
jgi:tetratricopeptide (TPR) repeat protein